MTTATKQPAPQTQPDTLPTFSTTTWSREHWRFLNSILQLRRRGPLHTPRPLPATAAAAPSPRRLLGKTVSAQGKTLRLEQWHLDVIHAFRDDVGGWDEVALARRLVALFICEERRRARARARAVGRGGGDGGSAVAAGPSRARVGRRYRA